VKPQQAAMLAETVEVTTMKWRKIYLKWCILMIFTLYTKWQFR